MLHRPPPFEPISKLERIGIGALLVLVIAFGVLVEVRSAFLDHRRTDITVYLRAAWAARQGENIYKVTNERGWHYHYPPFVAIALRPFAQPPLRSSLKPLIPYPVTVAFWYISSVLALTWGVHRLASALEECSTDPRARSQPRYCRQWWALRLLPVLICAVNVGSSLSRSQVDMFLLAILCLMAAAVVRRQDWRAGLWLGAAITIKVIPAFLLLYPLWRRNLRMLAGTAIGLVLGLVVIPSAVLGPRRSLAYGKQWVNVLLMPSLGEDARESSRMSELHSMTATDNQSLVAVIHNTIYANLARKNRPEEASPITRAAGLLIGAVLTVLTLRAAGRRRSREGAVEVAFIGLLICVMLALTPVCHLQYFVLALPLVMAVLRLDTALAAEDDPQLKLWAIFAVYIVANVLPRFEGPLDPLRDLGLAMYAGLFLWLVGARMARGFAAPAPEEPCFACNAPQSVESGRS